MVRLTPSLAFSASLALTVASPTPQDFDVVNTPVRVMATSIIGGTWSPGGNGGVGGQSLAVYCKDSGKKLCSYGGDRPPFETGMKDYVSFSCEGAKGATFQYQGEFGASSASIKACKGGCDQCTSTKQDGKSASSVEEYYGLGAGIKSVCYVDVDFFYSENICE